jgi:hypothetical protein
MASQLCLLPTNAGLGVRDAGLHDAQSTEVVTAGRRPAEDQNVSPIYQRMRISTAIEELSQQGLYGIPLRIDMVDGEKKTQIPTRYKHLMRSVEAWTEHIDEIIACASVHVNAIALLCGISDLFVLDIDAKTVPAASENNPKAGKRDGTELWTALIAEHGDIKTMKASTGSGLGLHLYFSKSKTLGLQHRKNFTSLRHLDLTWAIDGRGGGGVVFVSPSTYHDKDGATYGYNWLNGDASSPRNAMPEWLIKILNAALEPTPAVAQQTAPNPPSIPLDATTIHGVPEAVHVVSALLQKKLPGDRSRFVGMRPLTKTNWHVMGFKTVGVRTCINGCNHRSKNFSVLSNGAILLYRCLGSECIKKAKRMLGVYFWPDCLPLTIDEDNSRVMQDCQKYICSSNEKDSEAAAKQEVATLLDIVIKVMKHYFGVVTGSSRIIYTETLFRRASDNSLKPSKKILRSGHEFKERCETLGLSKVPGMVKNAGAYWRSSSARRQYDKIVFYPSLNEGNPKHFNLFNGLLFEPLKSKLTEERMRECEAMIPKLLWHIRYILANGCELAYRYLFCWLAHVI